MRVKRLIVSPEALAIVMKEGTSWSVVKGVPEGAAFRGVTLDPYAQMINIFLEHESFDVVEEGQVAPALETAFKRL